MKLTPELVLEARRETAKGSLATFARMAWPVLEPANELKWGWALDAICEHLEAVNDGRIKRLLMNVPPGSMKSLLTGVIYPAWVWGPMGKPEKRFLATAHKQDLAVRDNLKCRRLIQSKWFQNTWPTQLAGDQNAKTKFENTATGFREAMAFTSMTGARGDCFLAGTKISTDIGIVAIEDIVNNSISCNVLSYDRHSERLVYRPVEAVARRSSKDFYRVHFASGGMVECTGDHRFHTERGWKEARLLSSDDVLMRSMRGGNETERLSTKEGRKKWRGQQVLQSELQPDFYQSCGWQDGAELQRLWGENTQRQTPVRGCLRQEGYDGAGGVEENPQAGLAMRDVQQNVSAAFAGAHSSILLQAMRGGRPFATNEGRGKPRLAKRGKREALSQYIHESISEDASQDIGKGQIFVRRLQSDGRPLRSSHRHKSRQQLLEESSDSLQVLPCHMAHGRAPETEKDSVALVERVCEPTVVYDIQVAGTRCFFANGILVHNCVILDDPHSVDDANSPAKLATDILTFREALPSRVNNDESAIVIIMQRLNEGDVSAVAKDLGYEHLMIPMRFEADRACTTSIGWTDPRREDGELMFPERFPERQVVELERTLGSYATAGQLQQRPAPRDGGLFKRTWFRAVGAVPAGHRRYVRAWDLAATKKATSNDPDWTVGLLMSRGDDGVFLIEGVERLRGSPMEVAGAVRSRAGTDPRGTSILIPQDPGQAGKAQAETFVKDLAGYIVKTDRPTGDKATRAMPAAVQAEAGQVAILVTGDADRDKWVEPFLNELTLFPGAMHDDQVDAFADALNELALGGVPYKLSAWG